jgi:hypothetical protein
VFEQKRLLSSAFGCEFLLVHALQRRWCGIGSLLLSNMSWGAGWGGGGRQVGGWVGGSSYGGWVLLYTREKARGGIYGESDLLNGDRLSLMTGCDCNMTRFSSRCKSKGVWGAHGIGVLWQDAW